MVSYAKVQESNALISSTLPANLVAVFVGATSGIGEHTLKAFAKHTKTPRVYFVGRAQEAGDRIKAECEALCPGGKFIFMQSDVALLKNVDDVCRKIKQSEKAINLLVVSQGTLMFGTETSEGMHYAAALTHHSRFRFALNLLPLLRVATHLRRVVSVFCGGKEGPLYIPNKETGAASTSAPVLADVQGRNIPFASARGHAGTLQTFGLESLANLAPEVGFVHVFPGFVKSGITRGTTGITMGIFKVVGTIAGYFLNMDPDECGDRHMYLATSARYTGRKNGMKGDMTDQGIPVAEGVTVAVGVDGQVGSGVYAVDEHGESAGSKVIDLLAKMRAEGAPERIWQLTLEDFRRVTGSDAI